MSKEANMVRFINKYTGTDMWVADDRVEEYKAAGHKLAAFDTKPAEEEPKSKSKAKKTK